MRFSLPAKAFHDFEQQRRQALKISDQLRIDAKCAIGALLKDDQVSSKKHLKNSESQHKELKKLLKKTPFLFSVGGVHVGTEEYVEAQLLADYLAGKKLSSQKQLGVNHQDYICGLCDMTGELLRYARKHPDVMIRVQQDIEDLYQTCTEIVVTRNGAIRKKLEDLERNLKKIEDMIFQWELRHPHLD